MIISEKQIMELIQLLNSYREVLHNLSYSKILPKQYEVHLELSGNLLNKITQQQSEELKLIE